jgi:hypothetical protein
MLDLKGVRASHRVTTADGKKETSYAWYNVPLLDAGGRTRQVKASGVVSTASSRPEEGTGEPVVTSQERPWGPPEGGSALSWSLGKTTWTASQRTFAAGADGQREAAL